MSQLDIMRFIADIIGSEDVIYHAYEDIVYFYCFSQDISESERQTLLSLGADFDDNGQIFMMVG